MSASPPSRRWHVAPILGVRRVRAAAQYYCDALGFELTPEGVFQPSPDEADGVYAIVERQGVVIHLQIRRGPLPERARGAFERDAYLYVGDLDRLHEDLKGRGARILAAPHVAPHGIRELVVEDLDGHRLAFGEPR